MFAAYYNFCWRTRKPNKSGRRRPTAAVMAGLADHTWSFDELFDAVIVDRGFKGSQFRGPRGASYRAAECGSMSGMPILAQWQRSIAAA